MAIEIGYPDPAAERELLVERRSAPADGDARRRSPTRRRCWSGRRKRPAVHVSPALLDYVQALLAATRGNVGGGADAGARRGLSPRAGLLLIAAARAWALLSGRPMVLPEDVQAVFPSVAGHRLAGGARAGALQAQAIAAHRRAALTPARAACVHDRVASLRRSRSARAWRAGYLQRLFRHAPADHDPVILRHRRIYILPTRRGYAFLATLGDDAAHVAQLLAVARLRRDVHAGRARRHGARPHVPQSVGHRAAPARRRRDVRRRRHAVHARAGRRRHAPVRGDAHGARLQLGDRRRRARFRAAGRARIARRRGAAASCSDE